MAEEMETSLGYVERCLVAARASMNASALGRDGSSVPLLNCGIDTLKIQTLGEYLAKQKAKENPSINMNDEIEGLLEDTELARCFVIPVILPNGQELEVIVNKKGQDMACVYKDQEGNEQTFELTPRMKKEIVPNGLEQFVSRDAIEERLLPKTLEDFSERISENDLVPETEEDAIRKATSKTKPGEKKYETEEDKKEREAKENELPPETRDIVSKICSENDLDIKALTEVMEVPPKEVIDKLENTGFRENDGLITCLRFKDGEKLQGRVVMVQGDKVVNEDKYDNFMTDYMNEHKGQKRVEKAEEEHDKITYTDLHGNTTVCEITREPRDLECSKKEEINKKMGELDLESKQIKSSDMPIEMKIKAFSKINQDRLNLFEEYGIEVPLVENEIEADLEIAERAEQKVEDRQSEEGQEEAQPEKNDDDIQAFEVPGKITKYE